MTKRVLLGGVLGGVLMFVWGAVSHMLLQIGDSGIRALPAQERTLAALRDTVPEPGLYFFPWEEPSAGATKEQAEAEKKKIEEMFRTGPSGLLVLNAPRAAMMPPSMLLLELGSNVLACVVAGFLLASTTSGLGYGGRLLFVALIGLASWLSIEVSYWNWYGFPTAYAMGQLVDQVVGFGLAGLALAGIVKRS